MLCSHCKKKQAIRTKEIVTDTKEVVRAWFCAECYHALFLLPEDYAQPSLEKCPYCGKSKVSVLRSGLVGCANCYNAFAKDLFPFILKTQGDEAHNGKQPPALTKEDRLQIRYNELQVLIRQGLEEENVEKVKAYSQESARIKSLKGGKDKCTTSPKR